MLAFNNEEKIIFCVDFSLELIKVKPVFSSSEEPLKNEPAAIEPFLKILNILVKVQELGVTLLHRGILDVQGLLREIIDVLKEEPVKRFGLRSWSVPFLLFFFLVDIVLGVIRKVSVESSNLRGQLEEG